ncbi:hypothetical protein BP6252_14041 [Coleophoma cylindrospora]|uniref:Uncharacterized protein n=1 Tax=Coleophoma cylindrospora TaxID=1849047 RepID=A0A3D8Q4D4_9HELO|nr:hypothetical protein BP6252_14041 [Coleophoma cylindrospora]
MEQGYLSVDDTSRLVKVIMVDYSAKDEAPEVIELPWPKALEGFINFLYKFEETFQDLLLRRSAIFATEAPKLNQSLRLAKTGIPVPRLALEQVAVSLEDFEALWQNDAGSVSILREPLRFLMQTPNDGGLFCSMVTKSNESTSAGNSQDRMATFGRGPFSTIFIGSESEINFLETTRSYTISSNNRSDVAIILLPLEILVRHVRQLFEDLARLISKVSVIENVVINGSDSDMTDFRDLIKRLHVCSQDLVKLRRRWHFQVTLATTIREFIVGEPIGSEQIKLWGAVSLQLKMSQSLEYDLNVLPERIHDQSNAIFNLMVQRDTQTSMDMAKLSRQDNLYMRDIAAATLRDSSSMKTIAVMTMVFLPGTFICSFFSMTMFDWSSQPQQPSVSPYIWVYFAVMVPLTLLVIAVWWWKTRESRQEQEENKKFRLARSSTWRTAFQPEHT